MSMYTPPNPAVAKGAEASSTPVVSDAAPKPQTEISDTDLEQVIQVSLRRDIETAHAEPEPQPEVQRPSTRPEAASQNWVLRVSVRGPESPFDNADAVDLMVSALLSTPGVLFVNEQETLMSYLWNGVRVKKPQTLIEAQVTSERMTEAEDVIRAHHPDRAPQIHRFPL